MQTKINNDQQIFRCNAATRKLSEDQSDKQSDEQSSDWTYRQSHSQSRRYLAYCAMAFMLTSMLTLLPSSTPLQARDDLITLPVASIFDNPEFASRLTGVEFYFGETPHPEIAVDHGEFTSVKKTNAFRKDDQVACDWAMLSALLVFKERALSMGADAVVAMRSYYKHHDFRGDTEYQCGAGNMIAGVTIKGHIVKFK